MTPRQIELVRESWAAVTPIAEAAAQHFYQRLFEIDPSTRQLFAGSNMPEQGRRLMSALSAVVVNADRPGTLVPALEALGRRHAGYGVEDRHYESVGAALLWTLQKGLGDAFTASVRDAWAAAYDLVSGIMRRAAQDAARSAA